MHFTPQRCPPRGKNEFKPRPQDEILVPSKIFENYHRHCYMGAPQPDKFTVTTFQISVSTRPTIKKLLSTFHYFR